MVQAIRTVGCIVLACLGIDCWRNSWTYSSGGPWYDYITLTHWPLGNFKWNFRLVIFKLNLVNGGWGISYEIALRWMSLDLTQGCQRSGKSQGKFLFFKVREKSGNSIKSQGKSLDMGKSGKSQGILWWMPMILFLITVVHFMFLSLVPCGKTLGSFWCHVIFCPL